MDTATATKLHDDLLASQPEGARHDADICPFCADKAHATASRNPPGSSGRDVSDQTTHSTEGGTTPTMSDISQEAHEALVKKAVEDAVQATEAALATKTKELETASARVTELETAKADLTSDNERINKELDEAQVKLQAATEEAAALKQAADDAVKAKETAELASKRGEQVKNLGLFPDEYVAEKASSWAAYDEAAWDERIDEWSKLRPGSTGTATQTDAASAMTGTGQQGLTQEQQDAAAQGGSETKPKARRSVLGLN